MSGWHAGKGGLGSTKFVAFETLAWHNECFFCNICKESMVGKGFIQVKTTLDRVSFALSTVHRQSVF
jgi:hypothetical protein